MMTKSGVSAFATKYATVSDNCAHAFIQSLIEPSFVLPLSVRSPRSDLRESSSQPEAHQSKSFAYMAEICETAALSGVSVLASVRASDETGIGSTNAVSENRQTVSTLTVSSFEALALAGNVASTAFRAEPSGEPNFFCASANGLVNATQNRIRRACLNRNMIKYPQGWFHRTRKKRQLFERNSQHCPAG